MIGQIQMIRCGFGLGNRVMAIANALTLFGEIQFAWRNNEACPVPFHRVFPNGVPGVTFLESHAPSFASRHEGKQLWNWLPGTSDPETYLRVFKALAFSKHSLLCDEVLVLRRLGYRQTGEDAAVAACHGPSTLILADSGRDQLATKLEARGIRPVLPRTPEMREDLDRTEESVLSFVQDWRSILTAGHVVAAEGRVSSLVFPAFAAGIPVTTTNPT